MKKFYTETAADTDIQTKLARLAISVEEITARNTLVTEVETARAEYLREVGESQQDTTKAKDAAIAKLDDWMADFDVIAAIALYDQPQLLEVLGIFVSN